MSEVRNGLALAQLSSWHDLHEAPACLEGKVHAEPRAAHEWIAGTDTRRRPVRELMPAGRYCWSAFSELDAVQIRALENLPDLAWLRVQISLRRSDLGPRKLQGHIPVRHDGTNGPAAGDHTCPWTSLPERLMQWQEIGRSGVFALGQKTFMSVEGDWPLLDICELQSRNEQVASSAGLSTNG